MSANPPTPGSAAVQTSRIRLVDALRILDADRVEITSAVPIERFTEQGGIASQQVAIDGQSAKIVRPREPPPTGRIDLSVGEACRLTARAPVDLRLLRIGGGEAILSVKDHDSEQAAAEVRVAPY